MRIRIRDWNLYFEQDRSRQWKHIKWVPIPNKQGKGYRKIMSEKNGLEIFACWIAIVQQGSLCDPRGDLTKYDLSDLSLLTLIDGKYLTTSIKYLSEVLDWIEVIKNLDISVKKVQKNVIDTAIGSSVLCNSIQFNSREEYLREENASYSSLLADSTWIAEQKRFHSGLNILLSLEKAHTQFWGTDAGWEHTKRKRSKSKDWKRTYQNALSQKVNQVWLPRDEQSGDNVDRVFEKMKREGKI